MVLFRFRYLRTSQLALLLGRSPQVIRRRMRELIRLGYVLARILSATEERAFALGRKGWEWVAAELQTPVEKLPYSRKAQNVDSLFFRHTLANNDTWVKLELATRSHPHVVLHRAIPEWEQVKAEDMRKTEVWKRYVLWTRIPYEEGTKKKVATVRPDSAYFRLS